MNHKNDISNHNTSDQNTTHLMRHLIVAIIFGTVLTLHGCEKQTPSGETGGQAMDKAIDKTRGTAATADGKTEETAQLTKEDVKSSSESVSDKAGPVTPIVEDAAITASIKADLQKAPEISAFKIDVTTVQGVVTLQGEVQTDAARERARSIAALSPGVVKVNNAILVKG